MSLPSSHLECICAITGPEPDDTTFDPACPFHGDNGTMIVAGPTPTRAVASQGQRVRWVGQEDAEGCALAVLAMLSGETYADVKAEVDGWFDKAAPQDWATNGTSHYTLDRYLAHRGFWMRRHYATWGLPLRAFAPLHYASVKQPSGRGHFVAVLHDGTVLDPMREGTYTLEDWAEVNQLVGLRAI